jgi:hypothetical protein
VLTPTKRDGASALLVNETKAEDHSQAATIVGDEGNIEQHIHNYPPSPTEEPPPQPRGPIGVKIVDSHNIDVSGSWLHNMATGIESINSTGVKAQDVAITHGDLSDSQMKRFEEFGKRLFSKTKEDVKKAEQADKELADNITEEPAKPDE